MTTKEIPNEREQRLRWQGGRCAICSIEIPATVSGMACLDHDHVSGMVRGVLCRNCNGIEGKISRLLKRAKRGSTEKQWLEDMFAYLENYKAYPSDVFHPTHRTENEKRLRRNKRTRKLRAAKKGKK